MPKREKSPPPPEDEPRYLVVVHPYPLNANLQHHTDRLALALWLACCTGKDALYAMFHKPASPGMVIIEVDRSFERFDSLLGMHIWSSFLKNPTDEEKDKASKVFWCHYNSGRLVEKNGWKRINVAEHWFHGWSPHNTTIKHPYPKTTYCDVPAEAQTGVPLCRPLPKSTFPPPASRPRPTVGSAEWIQSRSNVASEPPPSSRRRRGNRGSQLAPSDSASVVSYADARPPPPREHVVEWMADQHQRKGPVWATPPSSISSGFTLTSSTASSSVGSRTPSALGVTPVAAPPRSRSSVPEQPLGSPSAQYERLDWSNEVDISIDARDDAPTSPQSAGTSTTRRPQRRAPEPEGPIDPERHYEYEEDVPKRSTGDAMKAIFDGAPKAVAPVGNDAGLHDLEEEEEDDYLAWNYPEAVRTTTHDETPADDEDDIDAENPWEGYGDPRWDPPTKVNIKGGEEWICPEHGASCNPGICKARASLEAMRRKEKERDERLEARRKLEEKRRKRDEKRARKQAQADVSPDVPPHLAGHQYRGSDESCSESSGSDSPTGSGSQSPPPPSPSYNAAGAEGWADEGSLWDDGDKASPKVNLRSGWSASGSNRLAGEDEARSGGGHRTASGTESNRNNSSNTPTTRPQSARSAAWSIPSARGDATGPNSAQVSSPVRSQPARPGDARGVRPAATSTSPRGNGPPTTPQSPVSGPRQTVWSSRGAASPSPTTTSARGGASTDSQWPAPGQQSTPNTRRPTSAWTSPTPWSRQGNGRQGDRDSESASASPSTLNSSRSPSSPPGIFRPVDGGFPIYANTTWGDPIAVAQSSHKPKRSTSGTSSPVSRSAVGADTADGQVGGDGRNIVEAGQEETRNTTGENDRPGRGRGRGDRRGGRRGTPRKTATSPSAAPSDAPPNVLDITLPPGGPGQNWANENVEW